VSAYLNAYTPLNLPPNFGLDLNYLGDAGFSGASSSFQIVVAPFSTIRLPVNEINPGGGAGQPLRLQVDGFVTRPVPEPVTLVLVGSGAAVGWIRRQRRALDRRDPVDRTDVADEAQQVRHREVTSRA